MPRSKYVVKDGPKAPSKPSSKPTPMMAQFEKAKKEAGDALLFFRMGDFYELFGEDAKVASRELGITLTARAKGTGALPMAGVPVKSVDGYLMRLVKKGFKVAICEQTSDPRTAKGIVDRDVVRVVTAGTLTEEDALDARTSNYLAALHVERDGACGLAWVDLSTGRLTSTELSIGELIDELARIRPAELLWDPSLSERDAELSAEIERELGPRATGRDPWCFEHDTCLRTLTSQFKVKTLEGFGLVDASPIVPAAGALVEYLQETQRQTCEHVRGIELVDAADHLVLDRATRATLELVVTQRESRREGTLLDAIDATLTPMGGRLMHEWLLAPLRKLEPIRSRQRGVAELVDQPFEREDVRELLKGVLDVERLAARVSTGRANARDLLGLASSLAVVPTLGEKLADSYSERLAALADALDPLLDLTTRIQGTLVEQPPLGLREGGLIREGVAPELDELRRISGDGKTWMARFQAEESERTGIQGLKIGFNSVFGYFLEVPRGQVDQVPDDYIRKQTIKTAERYITPELKDFEAKVLKAEERSQDLEYELFCELRDETARHVGRILDTAHALAQLDVLAGLAQRAAENRYVAPELSDGDKLEIVDGRHPVVELRPDAETFVPNDTKLDRRSSQIVILTGPNMAGKSTYIRQTALITLLAQIGSFVPAKSARIGLVDRIFTRVGSADDIGRGASTFMVEMVEVANILNNASKRSLVVLDEVGRGTSTFDGLALAWAIVEHLREKVGCRALFATHYHQLTDLASRYDKITNMNVAVREWQDEIVFLHKIVAGGTDRSYGIQVARLAGVPQGLVDRAKRILADLERDEEDLAARIASSSSAAKDEASDGSRQLTLFASTPSPVEEAIKKLDLDRITPIEALVKLKELQEGL